MVDTVLQSKLQRNAQYGDNIIFNVVSMAFLNVSHLDEDIYIKPPAGSILPPGKTCFKLHKALYGLEPSPRAWNIHLNGHFKKLCFAKIISNFCVFLRRYDPGICILAIYVGDLVIAA